MLTKFRSALFFLLSALWTVVIGVAGLILVLTFKPKIIGYVAYFWGSGVMFLLWLICGVKVKISGKEFLPNKPFIIASKHQSIWETIFYFKLFYNPVIILKKELIRIPIYGWYVPLMGFIYIDRESGISAIKRIIAGAKKAVNDKRIIIIFPEGTRSMPGEQKPIKSGLIAIHRAFPELPIVPVTLNSGELWATKSFIIRSGTINLKFLPVIVEDDKDNLLKKLHDAINSKPN